MSSKLFSDFDNARKNESKSNQEITCYQSAILVNNWLLELGINKVIPTQMIYNYTTARINKGLNPFIVMNEKTKRIKISDLRNWFDSKYIPNMRKHNYIK
jgi:hypothetical protein